MLATISVVELYRAYVDLSYNSLIATVAMGNFGDNEILMKWSVIKFRKICGVKLLKCLHLLFPFFDSSGSHSHECLLTLEPLYNKSLNYLLTCYCVIKLCYCVMYSYDTCVWKYVMCVN